MSPVRCSNRQHAEFLATERNAQCGSVEWIVVDLSHTPMPFVGSDGFGVVARADYRNAYVSQNFGPHPSDFRGSWVIVLSLATVIAVLIGAVANGCGADLSAATTANNFGVGHETRTQSWTESAPGFRAAGKTIGQPRTNQRLPGVAAPQGPPGFTCVTQGPPGRPSLVTSRFLDAVEQVESGGKAHAIGDGGKAMGSFQFWRSAWEDANRIREGRGLERISYEVATNRPAARSQAEIYLTHLAGRLERALHRPPTGPELWATWNLGFEGFRRRGFDLSRCPDSTRRAAARFDFHHSTALHDTPQHVTAPHSATLHDTAPHTTARHSTSRHNTKPTVNKMPNPNIHLLSSRVLSADAERIAKRLMELKPDEMIGWDALNELVPGRDLKRDHRYIVASAVRHLLSKHKIDIHSVNGKGLKRPTTGESAALGEDYRQRIHRAAKKLGNRVGCADFASMSNEDLVKANSALSMAGALSLFTGRKTRDLLLESTRKAGQQIAAPEALAIPSVPEALFGKTK